MSKKVVGSSSNSVWGSWANASARKALWRWPPDKLQISVSFKLHNSVAFKDFNTIDLSRLLNFTSNISSISEDSSVVGRILSIVTSFEAIKMFPFGVNFSFIDQQIVMQNLGYPTFPHSYFLSFYLVSGLVSIYFLYVITKYLFKSTKKWKPLFILIFIYFLIGDGLFVNFKIFFMVFLIIGIINDRKDEILVTKWFKI